VETVQIIFVKLKSNAEVDSDGALCFLMLVLTNLCLPASIVV